MFGMFFFASLYVQEILGYNPLHAGLAFLPVTVGIGGGAAAAQQLISRFGVRGVAAAGVLIAAVGMVLLTTLSVHGSYGSLLVGLIPLSLGMGLTFVPITLLATSGVSDADAGLASGLFNTAQQVGGSLGLALMSTFAASRTSGLLGSITSHTTVAAAKVAGYHVAFVAGAVMLLLAALIIVGVLRARHVRDLDLTGSPSVVAA
jgi:MFS family permease